MSILIVGSVALDSVETPFGAVEDALGGSAVHAALAARMFSPVEIVGVVGEDFPKRHTAMLGKRGIGIEGLEHVKGGKTFRWGGVYHEDINERDTLFTQLNVFEHFRPKVSPHTRELPFVFLANINPSLQIEVLDQCKKPRIVMLDTMNLWIDIAQDDLRKVIKRSDIVLMNDQEARQFAETRSLEKAARAVLALGPKRVIIKKGEHGCMMFSREGFFAVSGLPLKKVVDPTGAGDSFAGGFFGYLATQKTIDEAAYRRAIVAGTATASVCVEGFGTKATEKVTPEQLRTRIAMVADSISCPKPESILKASRKK